MTRMICTYSVAVGLLFVCSPTFAQTNGDRIRASVKNGQAVKITDDQGRELQGRISAMTADGLSMKAHDTLADFPYDQIIRIDHPNDTLKNGALIGLAVGAALGAASLASVREPEGCDDVPAAFSCGEPTAGGIVAGALLMGGLGTAVGVGIDALIHRNREIYRRGGATTILAPVLTPSVRAAFVSVKW